MTTPGAPSRATGPPATIWQGNDGRTITGQETANERANRMEAIRREAAKGSDLRSAIDAEAASESKTDSRPSTPEKKKGGTRIHTQSGGEARPADVPITNVPITPPRRNRPIVVPGAPVRPNRTGPSPTGTARPMALFSSVGQSRTSRSSQGPSQVGGLKCGSNAVKTRHRERGVVCVQCGRNHVKTWDKRANSYYCRPRFGGKKTKRSKRSSKKTRRTHKKSKSHRKRR